MELRKIDDSIEYLPASEDPLSADVVLIHGDRYEWIFDVGASAEAVSLLQSLEKEKNIILSHFHEDHTRNLKQISAQQIYCGEYTSRKIQGGIVVQEPLTLQDGVKLRLFLLPSSHAKGCVGLEVDDRIAFLGDALYSTKRKRRYVYVANDLKQTIETIRGLSALHVCLSHREPFVMRKEAVLTWLESIYAKRDPKEAYIDLEALGTD